MRLPLATQFYRVPAKQFDSQRLVNLYIEAAPPEARSPAVFCSTPGSEIFCALNSGPLQGMHAIGDMLYVVSGGILFSVSPSGVATEIGGAPSTQTYVDFIEGQLELMIAAGQHGYIVTLDTGDYATIDDPDFPGARSGIFMDGVAVVIAPDSAQSNVSGINDFTAWDELEFLTETTVSQTIKAIRDDRKEFWMFGEKAIIPYARTGTGGYPFERVTQAILEMGLVAQWSVAVSDNSYFWLGRRDKEGGLVVWRASGYTPERISTHAIEDALEGFPNVEAAIAFTYVIGGHGFYVLNVPDRATFVFDMATGLWHEWEWFGASWSTFTHHAFFNKRHIVGGANGTLYALSPTLYQNAGETIQRKMVTPVYDADGKALRVNRVEMEIEAGVGLPTGQGSDPQIMARWSKNAGRTWSNLHTRPIGAQGKYQTRAIWRNLGRGREWALELTYSEPTPFSISKGYVEANVGRS